MHEAWFEVDTREPEALYQVLLPELASQAEIPGRSQVNIQILESALRLDVKADDVVSLRAALNTWLRLIAIALEILEVK